MYRVYVTRRIPEEGLKMLQRLCQVEVWEGDVPPPREVLMEKVEEVDGLVSLLSDRIDGQVLSRARNLKVVANYAVGYDNIDLLEAEKRGVVVTNTPGILTETTADLTWALLLAAGRRIVEADTFTRKGQWKSWGPRLLLGQDIHGSNLGIVGLGRIGAAVARRAQGFAMNVLYYNRTSRPDYEEELGVQRVELEELLQVSDFVSIHVPLTEDTHHLLGKKELDLMKPSAVLVNTARGEIVDEEALIQSLQEKKLFAAGLDVFAREPIDEDHPLLQMEQVVVLPHIGSASFRTRARMAQVACENLLAVLEGKNPPNPVSR